MTPTTILVWGVATGIGGTEARMAEVIAHWHSAGRRIVSVTLSRATSSPLLQLLRSSGSDVVSVSGPVDLARVLRREQPRLVVAFGLRASMLLRSVRLLDRVRRPRSPFVLVDARNGLEAYRSRLVWFLDARTARLVDVFLANSDAVAAKLRSQRFAARRVRVLYSALGDAWRPTRADPPRQAASVAMVGNARPEKQQEVGLTVFAGLTEPGTTLTVFTDDATDLRRRWQELASDAIGRVSFREGFSMTRHELASTAIVLHPSSFESAPRCLMEARACGCFVVAFDVGDTRRIVGDGGTVVPAGDTDALAAALEQAVRRSVQGDLPHRMSSYPSVPEYATALSAFGDRR